jgi:16S rRNA (guanine966-N2)-methyltransferase
MRIVAGRWKGRELVSPAGPVRPTAEGVRDAWMTELQGELEGIRVLELFAGSGALGIEALSRGARYADFVENHPAALHALKANIVALRLKEKARVFKQDAIAYMRKLPEGQYDLVLADPPYGSEKANLVAERWLEVPFGRILCIEHQADHKLPRGGKIKRYGDAAVTTYRMT